MLGCGSIKFLHSSIMYIISESPVCVNLRFCIYWRWTQHQTCSMLTKVFKHNLWDLILACTHDHLHFYESHPVCGFMGFSYTIQQTSILQTLLTERTHTLKMKFTQSRGLNSGHLIFLSHGSSGFMRKYKYINCDLHVMDIRNWQKQPDGC